MSAGQAAGAVRSIPCPECWAGAGGALDEDCGIIPPGLHVARWAEARRQGLITEAQLGAALDSIPSAVITGAGMITLGCAVRAVSAELAAWRAAAAEPGEPQAAHPDSGRLDAIRGVLAAFDWGTDDLQYALEKIDQLADASRAVSGAGPGGAAALAPADLTEVLGALEHAAAGLVERAGQHCEACVRAPAGICSPDAGDLDQAAAYRALAARLGGDR